MKGRPRKCPRCGASDVTVIQLGGYVLHGEIECSCHHCGWAGTLKEAEEAASNGREDQQERVPA